MRVKHLYWSDVSMDYEEVLDKDKNASSSSSTEDDATTISNNSISCSSSNISSNSSVNYQLHTDEFGQISLPMPEDETYDLLGRIYATKMDLYKKNCLIVKQLYDMSEKLLAMECLDDLLLKTIFANGLEELDALVRFSYDEGPNMSSSPVYESNGCDDLMVNRQLVEFLFSLCKTIVLFKEKQNYLQALSNAIIESLKPADLKDLLRLFRQHAELFVESTAINFIFEHRQQWLKERTRIKPSLKYAIPDAEFPFHPDVESFLRSERSEIRYFGIRGAPFTCKADAHAFVNKYDHVVMEMFCTKMRARGNAERAHVMMTKSRHRFDRSMQEYQRNLEELKNFNCI